MINQSIFSSKNSNDFDLYMYSCHTALLEHMMKTLNEKKQLCNQFSLYYEYLP